MENVPPQGENAYMSGRPSGRQQSYGAIISIIIIVVIIVVGAFYTWGKRLAENAPSDMSTTSVPSTQY
jgi:amino acid transporter